MPDLILKSVSGLVRIFGVPGTLILIFLVLSFLLGITYIFLKYGHSSVKLFLKFILDLFKLLISEVQQFHHPAVKVELIAEAVLSAAVVVTIVALVGKAVIPWIRKATETHILYIWLTSTILLLVVVWYSSKLTRELGKPSLSAE